MLLLGRGIGQLQPDSRGLLLLDGLEAEYVAFLLALAQEVGREVNLKVVTVEAELPQQDFCCLLCYLYPFQQPDLKLLHRPILLNHPYAVSLFSIKCSTVAPKYYIFSTRVQTE